MKMLKYVGSAPRRPHGPVVAGRARRRAAVLDPQRPEGAARATGIEQRTGRSLQVPGSTGTAMVPGSRSRSARPARQCTGFRVPSRCCRSAAPGSACGFSGPLLRRRLEFDTPAPVAARRAPAIAPDGHDNWSDVPRPVVVRCRAGRIGGGATPLEMHLRTSGRGGQLLLTDARDSSRIELSG